MTEVVDIREADDRRDVIHRAVHLLAEGKLVAFPTETVYVVAAHSLQAEAVRRLQQVASAESSPPSRLGIKGAQEALDYIPCMSRLGRKLTRRCWPGPVTLAFDVPQGGLLQALPAETREAVVSGGEVQFRTPAHEVVLNVLNLMPAPLVLSAERPSEGSPAGTAAEIEARFQDAVALVIDDGPCRYREPATVVHVSDRQWTLREPGVVSETTLSRLAGDLFLFVCTGNTCRSPMAEGLFRKSLSERLQCSEEELFDRGFIVVSAGLSAAGGAPAAPESVEIGRGRGIDLRNHESQPLTDRLLDQADYIYTMTQAHRESILAARPDLADRVRLLARDGTDIPDPIGCGIEEYEKCGEEIERHVRAILEDIEIESR